MANNVRKAEIAARRFQRQIDQFTGPRMIRIVNEAVQTLLTVIKTRHMGGASTGPKQLARNSGRIEKKTTATRAKRSASGVSASINIDVPYASIHFPEGKRTRTVINARKGQALAIPLAGIKGPNKRPLFKPRSPQILGKYAAKGILYGRINNKEKQIPLFLLRTSVVVPARASVERDLKPEGERILKEVIEREAKKIFSGK